MMLEIQYGKALPIVQDKEWKIVNLNDIDDLYLSNRTHYDKCMESDLSYLKYREHSTENRSVSCDWWLSSFLFRY